MSRHTKYFMKREMQSNISHCILIVLSSLAAVNLLATSAENLCIQRVDALCPSLEVNCSNLQIPPCLSESCPASDVDYILTRMCFFFQTYERIERTVNSLPECCLEHMRNKSCPPLVSEIPRGSIELVDDNLRNMCLEILNRGETCILSHYSSPCSRQDYDDLMHAVCGKEEVTNSAQPAANSSIHNWILPLPLLYLLST